MADDQVNHGPTSTANDSALDNEKSFKPTGGLISQWEGILPADSQANPGPSKSDVEDNVPRVPTNTATSTASPMRTGRSDNPTTATKSPSSNHAAIQSPVIAGATSTQAPSSTQKPDQISNDQTSRNGADDGVLRAVEPIHFGQAYSDRNPAPNVQEFKKEHEKRQEASRILAQREKERRDKTHTQRTDVTPDTTGHEEVDGPKAGATDDVPIGAEKSNVLFQPTPNVDFERVFATLQKDALQVAYMVTASIVILDWLLIGGGFKGFLKSLFPAFGVAGAIFLILTNVGKSAANIEMEHADPKTEKLRYVPESVEWMNNLVETLWHTLQQDFFDNIATQVNETIKPLIPSSVPATVKITEIGHGIHSARVLSMRSLPDSEFGDLVPSHGTDQSGSLEEAQAREKAVEREEGGVFYNLEISIAYHESPFRPRKEHMHVDVLAMIGPVPLPVFVVVKEFVATIRIRLQMHPDLPFLKNVTFALTENPKINAGVSIGAPWAFDLLNLPIVDSVLASQINAQASAYIQPKSMSMDMTVYVGGSDQKEDTEAIGVLCVKIHRARKLARQDSRGPGADPYLTIAFSKYEKPMYATRIIKGDRNPVWEESAIIIIKAEHIKRNENVLLRLWDSDTTGSDDVSGVCEFPLQELVMNSNKMEKREDRLQGDAAGTDAEGVLEWEIGYFPRAKFQRALRTDAKDPRDHHGETKDIKEEEKVQDAQNTVPDPNLPSGILELTIHQCINVEVKNPNKSSMGHVKVQHQDSDGEDDGDEETVSVDYIPSLYVTADIDDELVYRTRVKNISSTPTFNSTTETYIRDWRLTNLCLSVWDTRRKTDDTLVGVASLKLSDIFNKGSSVVRFYDLKGGEGSGRIRVSMIFRSMQMKLDTSLLGFSVGSFVFTSPIVCTGEMYTSKLKLRTSGSQRPIKSATKADNAYTWELTDAEKSMPVRHRYLSPLVFEFVQGVGLTEKLSGPLGKNKHYAVLWLFKLVDNEVSNFTLPIYKTNNKDRFIQNVVDQPDENMTLEKVGEVKFSGKFKAGLDDSHGEFIDSHDRWSTYESWKAAKKSGQRGIQTNRATNEEVDRLAKGIERSQSIKV